MRQSLFFYKNFQRIFAFFNPSISLKGNIRSKYFMYYATNCQSVFYILFIK